MLIKKIWALLAMHQNKILFLTISCLQTEKDIIADPEGSARHITVYTHSFMLFAHEAYTVDSRNFDFAYLE